MTARRGFNIAIEPIDDLTDRSYRLYVTVHPTLAEMRKAARKAHPGLSNYLDDSAGCFRIAPGVKVGGTLLGTMRLSDEALAPWVVMHEAVHAGVAMAFSECNRGRRKPQPIALDPYLAGGWADREELIAYGAHAFAFGIMSELGLIDLQESYRALGPMPD